ncbi:hypothetical protein [Nonomuraea sp. NPDC003709]|uniref:hypothetical protein n=1 Tax=Nonomuraea sp. NPDC003709 TaxID=3154450 RepID=UPI0033B48C33
MEDAGRPRVPDGGGDAVGGRGAQLAFGRALAELGVTKEPAEREIVRTLGEILRDTMA